MCSTRSYHTLFSNLWNNIPISVGYRVINPCWLRFTFFIILASSVYVKLCLTLLKVFLFFLLFGIHSFTYTKAYFVNISEVSFNIFSSSIFSKWLSGISCFLMPLLHLSLNILSNVKTAIANTNPQ